MKEVICIFVFFCSVLAYSRDFLFENDKSEYSIVVLNDDLECVDTAAKELQKYLQLVGNVNLPIVKCTQGVSKAIFLSLDVNEDKDSYHYFTVGNLLYITGGSERGLLYGVYAFLENELNVSWFTSDFTQIVRRNRYEITKLDIRSKPAFPYRLVFYYKALTNNEWCAHNMLNTQNKVVKNSYGGMDAWWGMHTFDKLIPSSVYFNEHPEFFSLRDGRRISNGQLCLTNPDLLTVLCKSLHDVIQKNPDYYVYDVSQNDNLLYCQCSKCEHMAKRYGGQTGLLIWFVNQVAENISKKFPDKMIGTFAYRYSRSIPKGIYPHENVAIRLCSFECCFSHALNKCERNVNFLNDLKAWSKLTPNINIYDYCVGFKQYLAPHPYFRSMAKRLCNYKDYGVKTILMLGQYESEWGEFSEMRAWVSAKLMWNPEQNVDSLAKKFIDGYYGRASSNIWNFYLLTQSIADKDNHFTIYCDYKNKAYSNEYMKKAKTILEHAAKQVVNDSEITKRVNRVLAQIYYLEVMQSPVSSRFNGVLQKLRYIIEKDPTYAKEYRKTLNQALGFRVYL